MEPTQGMLNLLRKLYFNPDTGFGSIDTLYRQAKARNSKITRKIVKEFIDKQATAQLNKPRKRKSKKQLPIAGPIGQWNIDLIFYPRYKRQNKGFGIILTAVEVNSKFAFAYPLKKKNKGDVADAIEQLVKDIHTSNRKITILHSDNGTEFKNKTMEKLTEKHGIEQVFCKEGDHTCNGVVERFNRTIKTLISKYFTHTNDVVWLNVLDRLMKNYNNRYHSSLGKAPKEIGEDEELEIIFDKLKKSFEVDEKEEQFVVGDLVRIPMKKAKFAKEGENFSRELYVVSKVNVRTLKLLNEDGNALRKLWKKSEVLKVPKGSSGIVGTRSKKVNKKKVADKEARIERRLRKEGL